MRTDTLGEKSRMDVGSRHQDMMDRSVNRIVCEGEGSDGGESPVG